MLYCASNCFISSSIYTLQLSQSNTSRQCWRFRVFWVVSKYGRMTSFRYSLKVEFGPILLSGAHLPLHQQSKFVPRVESVITGHCEPSGLNQMPGLPGAGYSDLGSIRQGSHVLAQSLSCPCSRFLQSSTVMRKVEERRGKKRRMWAMRFVGSPRIINWLISEWRWKQETDIYQFEVTTSRKANLKKDVILHCRTNFRNCCNRKSKRKVKPTRFNHKPNDLSLAEIEIKEGRIALNPQINNYRVSHQVMSIQISWNC
jgi:hypothetical protein